MDDHYNFHLSVCTWQIVQEEPFHHHLIIWCIYVYKRNVSSREFGSVYKYLFLCMFVKAPFKVSGFSETENQGKMVLGARCTLSKNMTWVNSLWLTLLLEKYIETSKALYFLSKPFTKILANKEVNNSN